MLSNYYTKISSIFQDVIIKKTDEFQNKITIYAESEVKPHKCPVCGNTTKYIHDYRTRTIKLSKSFGKNVIVKYRQRRYVCKCCGKRFAENNSLVAKHHNISYELINEVFRRTASEYSFSSISKELGISVSSVIRIFDLIGYNRPTTLPEVLAFDEFKGNTGKEKYQVIITDPNNHEVLDILPCRKQATLYSYIKQWSREERNNVKFFVSDMWKPYHELADIYLKKATKIVDKYHYIRQIPWAFEAVRKRIQKKYGKDNRLLFKHSKRTLTMRNTKLNPEQSERVNYLLYLHDDIRSAYFLKELFYEIQDSKSPEKAKKLMNEWILIAQNSRLPEYQKCSKTLQQWASSIFNTFDYPYSNGFTEGCNNKIKVLKRNAYGYRNFDRFRKRILHMFNYEKLNKRTAIA